MAHPSEILADFARSPVPVPLAVFVRPTAPSACDSVNVKFAGIQQPVVPVNQFQRVVFVASVTMQTYAIAAVSTQKQYCYKRSCEDRAHSFETPSRYRVPLAAND